MTFSIPAWIVGIPAVLALACLAGALLLLRLKDRRLRPLALGPLALALLLGGCCAPVLYHDRVVVGPTRIEQTTGFWWSPTVKGFDYADVEVVRIVDKPVGVPGRERVQPVWEVHRKDGRVVDIDPGDLWEHNTDAIVPLLREKGVRVE